jgi:AraC family transcriptional regulator
MGVPYRHCTDELQVLDDGGSPALAAPADWAGLPVGLSVIPAREELRDIRSPEPTLLVAKSGAGRRWYHTGLRTRELVTLPRQFELYAKDFVIDHARWEGSPGQAICVQFPEVALRDLLRDDVRALSFRNLYEVLDDRVVDLASELALEIERGGASGRLYAQGLSLTLLGWLRARHGVGPPPPPRRRQKLARGEAARVLEYVEAHLGDDLSVAGLAGVAGLSTAHFSRLFRATFGRSPHGFVLERRVRAADEMLRRGQLSIAQVAYRLGFSSQAHFTQVFRRLTGRTPGRWRARGRSEPTS